MRCAKRLQDLQPAVQLGDKLIERDADGGGLQARGLMHEQIGLQAGRCDVGRVVASF